MCISGNYSPWKVPKVFHISETKKASPLLGVRPGGVGVGMVGINSTSSWRTQKGHSYRFSSGSIHNDSGVNWYRFHGRHCLGEGRTRCFAPFDGSLKGSTHLVHLGEISGSGAPQVAANRYLSWTGNQIFFLIFYLTWKIQLGLSWPVVVVIQQNYIHEYTLETLEICTLGM